MSFDFSTSINNFNTEIIETIIIDNNTDDTSDDYIWGYDANKIEQITAEVITWLNTNNYEDVITVINSNNTEDINTVLAIFDQVWEPLM